MVHGVFEEETDKLEKRENKEIEVPLDNLEKRGKR